MARRRRWRWTSRRRCKSSIGRRPESVDVFLDGSGTDDDPVADDKEGDGVEVGVASAVVEGLEAPVVVVEICVVGLGFVEHPVEYRLRPVDERIVEEGGVEFGKSPVGLIL